MRLLHPARHFVSKPGAAAARRRVHGSGRVPGVRWVG